MKEMLVPLWIVRALSLLLISICACQTYPKGDEPVRIDPGLPKDKIRSEILKFTPTGSNEKDVMAFATRRLKHGKVGPSYNRPNTIALLLGSYGFRLVGSNNTWVQWRFDENHGLVDVEVSKSVDTL